MVIDVSIHAPAWGATIAAAISALSEFRSTRPHGARPSRSTLARCDVSIHAPAWGATDSYDLGVDLCCFDPRARMGGDAASHVRYATIEVSIHAPAWGATLVAVIEQRERFRSTRPHGARPYVLPSCELAFAVSIHAPAWGATGFGLHGALKYVSIHAPAWGAT